MSKLTSPTHTDVDACLREIEERELADKVALAKFYQQNYYRERRQVHRKAMVIVCGVVLALLGLYDAISWLVERFAP